MSIENFIPTVWAASILENLNNDHVYGNALNTDYEGEIRSFGDSVKIGSIGRVTVKNYTKYTDIDDPEQLDGAEQWLTINQAKYFNFMIDDIDDRQSKPKLMGEATQEASWAMADAVDTYIAQQLAANVATVNALGDFVIGVTPNTNAYELLVNMDVKLTEANTPRGMRWLVVPPWFEGALRKDERFVSFGTGVTLSHLQGTPVGRASGFTIWMSNNTQLDAGNRNILLCGYKGAATYAEQLDETEAYRPQKRFGDALKGLHIYGMKVTQPSNIVRADVISA